MTEIQRILEILKEQHALMIRLAQIQQTILLVLTEDLEVEDSPNYLNGKPQ